MEVIKRDKTRQAYSREKIKQAIRKAFIAQGEAIDETLLTTITTAVETALPAIVSVEYIQDQVEKQLMAHGCYPQAKAYILYREEHARLRHAIEELAALAQDVRLIPLFKQIRRDFPDPLYSLSTLLAKYRTLIKEDMDRDYAYQMLIRACVELVSREAPKWEFIAARFLSWQIDQSVDARMEQLDIHCFYDKLRYLTNEGLYGAYILEHYTRAQIEELEAYLDPSRDQLFTYSGLDLLAQRYLIRDHAHHLLEKTQEMFMGIAMHLSMEETQKVRRAKELYDVLSTLKVTMATPTMSNARKPFHQMSSCFIDTVPDSLSGIYRSVDSFAQVSKFGGGMGLYFGKVRASGSDIRGYKEAAGGVIRWIRLVNDTAVAVDQLGVRSGAAAVYLDAWHRDLLEFLQLRTNNGDERMKAHDIFPAICYPDLFYKLAKENLHAPWYLMCPHEIEQVKGYCLEDFYGEEWEKRYLDCVQDERIRKRVLPIKEVIRLIIKSAVETGTPFAFNRDHVNRMNPNKHAGIIYCSNLCTEIAQNMSAMEELESETIEIDGEAIVIERHKAGDFVVCNLASLILPNIDTEDEEQLRQVIDITVRALDNVIDHNFYPIPYAKITNQRCRAIGLGTSGYHHWLVRHGIAFESEEHLQAVDRLYERINYHALQASCALAKEKGRYRFFAGSDYDNGDYFRLRGYESEEWQQLADEIHTYGLRNAYLLAIAPTSSTSIIAGTSAAVDPIMNKFFMEEKKGMMITRVAPDLSPQTFWLYKNAHLIDQSWVVRAAGIRQRHIDQAQSVNLYITNEFTFKGLLNLYIQAWENGVKTIYYVRSKSLEIEECESCSA
ncbi:ribonucleoside-diphosphate reductase subunit alpha [Amedibacillus dolichus]|uniref:Ribonucleoside-diphosphate reductase n=1 Tax=Amedibacillus dolichus TaxID=31971 RepID=A0ABT7UEH8_9FIRM|nr:ribonucleoside-diphosphate reductase subunit alpha [Amedibacillus dolichus]MDM8158021.1 ribonucleoside-diphosphate reductase subunit alpha [Amedibacillus dolichus]